MRVAVLGCGYVGLALGRHLRPDHEVFGVRRSDDGLAAVEAAGLRPVRADVTDAASVRGLPSVDAVVFAASAGGRDAAAAAATYVDGQRIVIETLGAREPSPERYVYTSSTGVYGDHGGDWVDEETPPAPLGARGATLVRAERVALEAAAEAGMTPTVTRLAGLYGPDRYRLERYLEGPVTAGYLNLCHRADAAGAIAHVLERDVARNEVVLVVDDEPVGKWALADWLADACGVARPPKLTVEAALAATDRSSTAARRRRANKRCRNDRLHAIGYDLAYPTFREGYAPAIREFRARAKGNTGEP